MVSPANSQAPWLVLVYCLTSQLLDDADANVKTNVVPSLVSRFAIVAKKIQIIQSPSNVWKVHYCGKNSWETIVLSKKMFV